MLKKINKILIISILLVLVINITFVYAADSIGKKITGGAKAAVNEAYGTNVKDQMLGNSLISIINFLLAFIAVLFFLGLIYAGYLWMTARGNDEQIDRAKKITREIVIGLIIIFLSRILTEFILNQVGKAIG